MENFSSDNLFEEMVISKIRCDEAGIVTIPIDEYRRYLNITKEENIRHVIGFTLPSGREGLFNYVLGFGTDEAVWIELIDTLFYDAKTEGYESISGSNVLNGAAYRNLYSGEALICGRIILNEEGAVLIEAAITDDIVADFQIHLTPDDHGIQLCSSDLAESMHVWSDGNKVYIAPSTVMVYHGLPS